MTKKKLAVKEVEVVLGVLKKYYGTNKNIPDAVIEDLINILMEIEKDYEKTIDELLCSSSLVVKMEKLIEIIGTVGTISVEDEDKMDKTIDILNKHINSIKN